MVVSQESPGTRGYRPIAEYGVIGDCRTAALVAPDGSIDWCCLPHFDSPALFCRLLDAQVGGFFQIHPVDHAASTMHYLDDTNILQTDFTGPDGTLQLIDFMPIRQRLRGFHLMHDLTVAAIQHLPMRMRMGIERDTGNDVAAAHRIDRIATALGGKVTVEVILKPTFDFARAAVQITPMLGHAGMCSAVLAGGGRYLAFVLQAESTIVWEERAGQIVARVTLDPGSHLVASLNYARNMAEAQAIATQLVHHHAQTDLAETRDYWLTWARRNRYQGPYRAQIMRSALALKLCTFEPTGAIVAAPTTSLPEAIGGVRNWDYRFSWLRDASLTLNALGYLGYAGEARDYFHFLHDLHLENGSDLRIMYGIYGETGDALAERELPQLAGYRDSRPVRIGNGAATQRQLDIYGELIDAAYHYIAQRGYRQFARIRQSERSLRSFVAAIADYVAQHWTDLDRGIWEVRGADRAFVYSRVMCWVALDRACRLATSKKYLKRREQWESARDALRADILAHGYDAQIGSFIQAYGTPAFDAANLRIPFVGFLPYTDPKVVSTIDQTAKALAGDQGMLFRYRPLDNPESERMTAGESGAAGGSGPTRVDDGLPGSEGAFLACSFWLVRNLAALGRYDEARDRYEKLLNFASPLGLFAEELDPSTGALLGNFPQAFSHIGLIDAAVALEEHRPA